MVGTTGGLAPVSSAFRLGIVYGGARELDAPSLLGWIKAFLIEGVFLIDIKPLQREGKSRPAAISITRPHPVLLAGIVAVSRRLGLFRGKLKRATKGKLGYIEVGIDLHMGNIKGFAHFGEAMDFTVQW